MTTREEFEELLYGHTCRACEVRRYEEQGIENEAVSAARNRRDELWFAILDAYDAQAARIATAELCIAGQRSALREKDERIAAWEAQLDAVSAALEARNAELEAQLDAVCTTLLDRGCEGVVHECAVLEARVKELEAMLRRLEFAGGAHATEDMCPLCCALLNRPHEPGCELAALLKGQEA